MPKLVNFLPTCKTLAFGAVVALAGFGALNSSPAQSWGFVGHEYIGSTTYEYLTPTARVWVDEHLQRIDETSLTTATTWADRVRGTEDGEGLGPLHYANVPPHATTFDIDRDCPQRRCVVGAAYDALDVIFDPAADEYEQADQLRKLSHWITDLHQPLHMGFAEDRGGNDLMVQFNGEEYNLHRVWDTLILQEKDLPEPAELAAAQPLPEHDTDWYQAIQDWATESNQLARKYAYADLEAGDALSDEYIANAREVIKQQLTASAQRMAQLINAAAAANQDRG